MTEHRATRTTPARATGRCPRRSTCPRSSTRCSPAGASGTSSPVARADRRRAAVDLLRGPADRQRPARHPPRRGPGLQGPVPPLQDDARPPRAAPGRLGLPRPAGRARGREAARLLRKAGHRGLRDRGVQRRSAASRSSSTSTSSRRMTERMGYWVDFDDAYWTMDAAVRRERLVVAEADLRGRPAGPGLPGHAVLPALRHRPVRPRGRPGLPRRHRPVGLRPVPGHERPARRAGRRAAGLDHHAVDPDQQHRGRRQPRGHLRRRPAGRRPTSCWSSPSRCSHAALGDDAEVLDRMPGTELEHTTYSRPFDLVDIPGAHFVGLADYVTVEDGTGLVHQAPAFGADDLAVARRYGLPVVNPVTPDGHFRGRPAAGRRPVLQGRRRGHRGRPCTPAACCSAQPTTCTPIRTAGGATPR